MEKIKNQSFPSKTVPEWGKKAEATLKGKTIESLETTTYENIILKPLYTRQDEQKVPDYPAGSDFRRGIDPLGYITNDWKVAQHLTYQTPEELQEKLLQTFKKGQTAISFVVSDSLFEADDSLLSILSESYNQYPFAINAKGLQTAFLAVLARMAEREGTGDKINGYIGSDPISLFAKEGFISEEFINDWVKNIQLSNEKLPNLRTILIDTIPYHNGGANAVQELGIAITKGVYYLERFQEQGLDLEDILAKVIFQFSIGGNFFMEIAKLRAARVLWSRITEVYGAEGDARGMHIAAETSSYTKSGNDPHVNLLRAGNEAFAATLGSVQYLHVSPFDDLTGSSPGSERIARNIQLLLKEEAHLKKVIDPAGGSWYVEELTNQLAEKAWGFFQEIEAKGGILESLKTGWLQKEIEAIQTKRNNDILTRKQSIIGTNVYVNLDEEEHNFAAAKSEEFTTNEMKSGYKIESIPQKRLSEPYEGMRKKAKLLEQKIGSTPTVALLCLGELKQHKPRLDFMKGFLAAGGIKAVESNPIINVEEARQFLVDMNANFVCFCGTNEQYELMGHEILSALKSEFPERIFYLAGLPEKEKQALWVDEGIKQFIHVKSNCYETLITILNELEVSTIEETKA